MPLALIDAAGKAKISPPPIHETLAVNGQATEVFVRYLLDLRSSGGNIYDELNRVITQVNLNIEAINAIQSELDTTQQGAGLNTDGTYIQPTTSNYIDSSTSLSNADSTLDTAIFDETRELITTTSISTPLIAKSQTVICDATSGAIDITLPDPTLCHSNNRSFRIAIYKKDTTVNEVTILPFGTEKIVGEVSQILNSEGDVINLITDGTNWVLGA
jgi:hypothetical protein